MVNENVRNRGNILDGLGSSRIFLFEGVTNAVKSDIKKLFSKSGADGNSMKQINNALNLIYIECNKVGENNFSASKYYFDQGCAAEVGDGEAGLIGLDVNPSCHGVKIQISADKSNIDIMFKALSDFVSKGKSSLRYSNVAYDPNGFTFFYDGEDDYTYNAVSISKRGSYIEVDVQICSNPLNEGTVVEAKNDNKIACARGKNLFKKLGFAFSKYCDDIECRVKTIETNYEKGGAITQIDLVIRDENSKARDVVRDFGFKPANVGVTSQDKLKDGCSGYRSKDMNDITEFIKFINKQTGELKGCVSYKDGIDTSTDEISFEGTDISNIDTPDGKLEKKEVVCPKCGSTNVNIRDDETFFCVECSYSWKEGEEVDEKGCKKRKNISVSEGASNSKVLDANKMYHKIYDMLLLRDDSVSNTIKKAFKYAGGTVNVKERSEKYVEYSGKIKGYTIGGSVSLDSEKGDMSKLAEDIAYAYFVSIDGKGSFMEILPMLKESKVSEKSVVCPKCGSTNVEVDVKDDGRVEYECEDCDYEWEDTSANESCEYKVGKRYKTDDGMYFVVKKINKDGSIRVYDEDVEKEYDCELSDLELLDPIMVK